MKIIRSIENGLRCVAMKRQFIQNETWFQINCGKLKIQMKRSIFSWAINKYLLPVAHFFVSNDDEKLVMWYRYNIVRENLFAIVRKCAIKTSSVVDFAVILNLLCGYWIVLPLKLSNQNRNSLKSTEILRPFLIQRWEFYCYRLRS